MKREKARMIAARELQQQGTFPCGLCFERVGPMHRDTCQQWSARTNNVLVNRK